MGVLRVRTPWTRQPQYPVKIDWENPLTNGLVFAAYPIGNTFYDAVSGSTSVQAGTSGTTITPRSTIDGNVSPGNEIVGSSTAAQKWVNQTGLDQLSGRFSMFVEGSPIVGATTGQFVFSSVDTSTGNGLAFLYDDAAVVNNGFRLWGNNSNQVASNFTSLGSNYEFYRHRAMITGDGANVRFYAKGKLDNAPASTFAPSAHSGRRTWICGAYRSGGAPNACSSSLCLAWNRPMSLPDFQALYNNPWQVFAP